MLFPSNQPLYFCTAVMSFSLDTLKTNDLKAFDFSSTLPVRISASLSFSIACKSSLLVELDPIGCELPD